MLNQALESELLALLGGDEKARIAARYCGFDGSGGTTLQAAGAEFGISAERVRQIVGEVMRRRSPASPPAPILIGAISFIAANAPGFADDIEPKLQSAGLSSLPFRIEGILRAAELFGKPVPFSLTETQRARLVHSFSPQFLDAIVNAARRTIERLGLATLRSVSTALADAAPEAADRGFIADVLSGAGDFRWLDQYSEWFWLPAVPRNPVVRRIRKILAVANPVRFTELCAGVAREYRLQSESPPPAVLLELCRQIPGMRVAGEFVEADPRIDLREVLGEVEQAIVELLAAQGGPMRRADLAAGCLERGLNRSSFYSALKHSPVIALLPANQVQLVGAGIAPPPHLNAGKRSKYFHAKPHGHNLSLRKWMA